MKTIGLNLLMLLSAGCAFKDQNNQSPIAVVSPAVGENNLIVPVSSPSPSPTPIPTPARFIPSDLKLKDGDKTYSLIDLIELPLDDYEIDRTVMPQGRVEFLYDYPSFSDTMCEGLGYSVSYDSRRRSATTLLKIIPYINRVAVDFDHKVASKSDTVNLAIYAEYGPLSDYLDYGSLPSEFVKSFQPSNHCRMICNVIRTTPIRPLILNIPAGANCNYWIMGHDDHYLPTSQKTDDLKFFPSQIENANSRDFYMTQLAACDAVRDNNDLKFLYQQAEQGECADYTIKTMMREWYFIEQKVPYKAPVYTIDNFSQFLKTTSNTQNSALVDHSAHLTKEWSN